MRLPERTKAVLFALVLLASIAALWFGVRALRPHCDAAASVTATLEVRGLGWNATASGPVSGCTVYDQLAEWSAATGTYLATRDYGEPLNARLVVQIGGDRNGGTEGRYWQYWVDCAYATAGADLTPLRDGDRVLWAFVPEQWEGNAC